MDLVKKDVRTFILTICGVCVIRYCSGPRPQFHPPIKIKHHNSR